MYNISFAARLKHHLNINCVTSQSEYILDDHYIITAFTEIAKTIIFLLDTVKNTSLEEVQIGSRLCSRVGREGGVLFWHISHTHILTGHAH